MKAKHKEHAAMERELKADPSWPPVSNKKADLAGVFQPPDSVPVEQASEVEPGVSDTAVCILLLFVSLCIVLVVWAYGVKHCGLHFVAFSVIVHCC